jgi:hypothetical protein
MTVNIGAPCSHKPGPPFGSCSRGAEYRTISGGASSKLLSENYGSAARDHHGVLELGHKTAVISAERPAIGIINDKVGRHGQKGFDG